MTDHQATPDRLRHLAQQGHLDARAFERAYVLAHHVPTSHMWRTFLDRTLLVLATLFTIAGVFFFFAYNWQDLPRFVKLGLIQAALVIAVGLAAYLKLETLPGKIALTMASLFVGVLLAVYGQIYQTGANAYTLFLTWAGLITGWVAISAFAPLYLILLILLNLTFVLYALTFPPGPAVMFWIILASLNGISLIAFEAAYLMKVSWMQLRWLSSLVAVGVLGCVLVPTVQFVVEYFNDFSSRDTSLIWLVGLYAVVVVVMSAVYLRYVRDLFVLTGVAFSVIVVVTTVLINAGISDSAGGLFVISFAIIGQAITAAFALYRIQRHWEAS